MAKIDGGFCAPECLFCDAVYSVILIWDFNGKRKGVFYCHNCGSQYVAILKID